MFAVEIVTQKEKHKQNKNSSLNRDHSWLNCCRQDVIDFSYELFFWFEGISFFGDFVYTTTHLVKKVFSVGVTNFRQQWFWKLFCQFGSICVSFEFLVVRILLFQLEQLEMYKIVKVITPTCWANIHVLILMRTLT